MRCAISCWPQLPRQKSWCWPTSAVSSSFEIHSLSTFFFFFAFLFLFTHCSSLLLYTHFASAHVLLIVNVWVCKWVSECVRVTGLLFWAAEKLSHEYSLSLSFILMVLHWQSIPAFHFTFSLSLSLLIRSLTCSALYFSCCFFGIFCRLYIYFFFFLFGHHLCWLCNALTLFQSSQSKTLSEKCGVV